MLKLDSNISTVELPAANRARAEHPWAETFLLSALAVLLGFGLTRSDPFMMRAAFPWLAFAPLLAGAQHGALFGVASSALLGAAAWCATLWGVGQPGDVASWSFGCAAIGAIAGEFRDVWQRRRCLAVQNGQRWAGQLQRMQRAYHVLKLSHVRLEERVAATRWSLAGAVESATRHMTQLTTPAELGRALLDVLASQALVQAASLYWVDNAGQLSPERLVALGSTPCSHGLHALVQQTWSSRRLTALVDSAASAATADPSVLAAVPLLSATGRMLGVVAVHQLPFIAFQADHLRNLLVLAGHLSDAVQDRLDALEQAARGAGNAADVEPPALGAARDWRFEHAQGQDRISSPSAV